MSTNRGNYAKLPTMDAPSTQEAKTMSRVGGQWNGMDALRPQRNQEVYLYVEEPTKDIAEARIFGGDPSAG